MKKAFSFLLTFVFVLSLAGCGAEKLKNDVFEIVEDNYAAIVKACENKDSQTLLAIDGISKVNIVNGYVLVYCEGAGISVSSQDYGFYYTEENIPVGVGCNLEIVCSIDDMQPKDSGYQGIVDYNTFYTEHIKGNIYFYSNAY